MASNCDPELIIDIDETSQAPNSFINRRGRAIRGKPCIRQQIVIGTRSFSTICALSPRGVIAFRVYEGSVTGEHVIDFLNVLELNMEHGHVWGIVDNAATHHTV